MPEYSPSYVGGSRVKANVLNLLPCIECGALPSYEQHSKDALCQSSIQCGCGQKVEDNIPVNQLVDIWNRQNKK